LIRLMIGGIDKRVTIKAVTKHNKANLYS